MNIVAGITMLEVVVTAVVLEEYIGGDSSAIGSGYSCGA
jgi:hypothetical protein